MALASTTITSPDGETTATFVPDANLVCASLVHRGAELLDVGRGIEAYAEQGKTMGIPLLYPWANRLSQAGYAAAGQTVTLPDPEGRYPTDPNGLPIHGALPGAMRWRVLDGAPDRLRAGLAWEDESLLALYPFRHHVECEAHVTARGLTLTTVVHADAGDSVPVSFGYHPYLTLPGSDRRGWQVDLGATEHLALDERGIPTGERTPLHDRDFLLGDSSWDDGLAGLTDVTGPAQFLVSDGERALAVSFEAGYPWAQIYAPLGHDYICLEPMTAPTDALNSHTGLTVLAPGGQYRGRFSVSALP